MGLEQLVYFDYLLVHSGDVANGPVSLHAAVPHRGGEWMTRRQYVEKGLEILVSRELALKRFTTDGIVYSASELATPLLEYFNTEYASLLKERAAWIKARFGESSELDLRKLLSENMSEWGAEFKREALIRGIPGDR